MLIKPGAAKAETHIQVYAGNNVFLTGGIVWLLQPAINGENCHPALF